MIKEIPPSCHGVLWDGTEGSECTTPNAKGKSCSAVDDCLAAFATGTLARLQKELGDAATPEKLAEVASVKVEAILLALEFQKNIGVAPVPGPTETAATETAATALLDAEQELQEFCDSPPDPGPAEEPLAVPAAPRKQRSWDPKHDAKRWKRERERSALIAQLVPNMLLRREYKGQTIEVKVMADGYVFAGHKYPTLYAVVKEVTGTVQYPRMKGKDGNRRPGTRALSNWSAARFFKLDKALKGRK